MNEQGQVYFDGDGKPIPHADSERYLLAMRNEAETPIEEAKRLELERARVRRVEAAIIAEQLLAERREALARLEDNGGPSPAEQEEG